MPSFDELLPDPLECEVCGETLPPKGPDTRVVVGGWKDEWRFLGAYHWSCRQEEGDDEEE